MESNLFLGRGVFNTLAQDRTAPLPAHSQNKREIMVHGNGSDVSNSEKLSNRCKKKLIAQKIAWACIEVAKAKGELTDQSKKPFWNLWHCQRKVIRSDGKFYGTYCKSRLCPVCNGNRRAELIRKYLPVLKQWQTEGRPYFVTLTFKAVPKNELKSKLVCGLLRAFRLITERYRKQELRGKSQRLVGFKVIECNFNPQRRTYNLHLHLIVKNKRMAAIFISEWMNLWSRRKNKEGKPFVIRQAQDMRPVGSSEKDLIELIKYSTKIFTPDDPRKAKKRIPTPHGIYSRALYNIYHALKGHRIFETFGFNLPNEKKTKGGKTTLLQCYENFKYLPQARTWVNAETYRPLAPYSPKPELNLLLENIDADLE